MKSVVIFHRLYCKYCGKEFSTHGFSYYDYRQNYGKLKFDRMRWLEQNGVPEEKRIKLSDLLDELKTKLDKGAPTNILTPKLAHSGNLIHGIK